MPACAGATRMPACAGATRLFESAPGSSAQEASMLIGTDIPTRGPFAVPDVMARIAQEAEALGFGYLTLSDHVLIPRKIAAPYPYTETGAFPLLDTNELQ